MSKNRTLKTNDLTVGATFAVKGKLASSRVASHLDGDELIKYNQRRLQQGGIPIDKPHTFVTIREAEVIYKEKGKKTPEEIYAEESLFESKMVPGSGLSYSITNKTSNLPYVVVKREGENIADRVDLEKELARGLDVTLIMRVFKSRTNNGISLDGVVITGKLAYYEPAQTSRDFSELDLDQLLFSKAG